MNTVEFEKLGELLPDGFHWGDELTVGALKEILTAWDSRASADDANVTELLSALDAAQEGCIVPSWAGWENGDGIEVGKRIDAAIAAMKGAK